MTPRHELPKLPADVIRQCDLTQKIHAYDPKADTGLIDAAYALAEKATARSAGKTATPISAIPSRLPVSLPATAWI